MMTRDLDHNATTSTRATYARIAPLYDFLETLPEQRYKTWRRRFWQEIKRKMSPGGRLLEVGVGTGKNMPYWPQDADITAVDLTPAMLRKAEVRAQDLQLEIDFRVGDAQKLEFPDNTFDLAAATFVFCAVPDPMMEHVRAENVILGSVMDLVNPIVVRMMGPNINRDTVGNVRNSGLDLSRVDDLGLGGIFKMIVARIGEVKMEMVD
jgi:2-polyprenyl-3-methyl-5-hydroxy-6-metoxy-1,4-benzoquinol methylase